MTRMTGPDCVVMCNLINKYIHTYIHTYIRIGEDGRNAKKRKKPQNSCRRRARNGGDEWKATKKVGKNGLVQELPTRNI